MLVQGKQIIRKDIKNILLIQLGDIGDVVLSFPCMRALKENFPESNIAVAVREKAKELIEDCPWTSRVISIREEKRRLGREIIYQKIFFSHLRKFNFEEPVREEQSWHCCLVPVKGSGFTQWMENSGGIEFLLIWRISRGCRGSIWQSTISIF